MSDLKDKHPAYTGTYRHALDTKHRVTIPSRWRQEGQDEFYLLPSPDGSFLCALPPAEFDLVYETLQHNPGISPADRRRFARQYFSQAQHCEVDRQGRLLVPDEFCRLAALQDELVLVGTYDRIEIWSPARWVNAQSADHTAYQNVSEVIGL